MRNSPLPRPEVIALNDYVPGKPIELVCAEHGLDHAIKLASNENPLGPSPAAVAAVVKSLNGAHRYPQGNAPELTSAVAAYWKIRPEQLVFANGSDEMIQMIALGWLAPGEELLCCAPTFSEYRFAAELVGGSYRALPLREGRYDIEGLIAAVTPQTKIIVICNPNNPTGGWVGEKEMRELLERLPSEVLVVIDQAYAEFASAAGVADYPDLFEQLDRPNLLLLRTFSKLFGLAGLRIGYAMGAPELIRILYKVKQPFNLGVISQVAAVAALSDRDHTERSLLLVKEGLALLQGCFDSWGWEQLPTAANFIAVRPREGSASALVQALEARGVILRWLKSFGMPEWFRITVGTPEENALFIAEANRWRESFIK